MGRREGVEERGRAHAHTAQGDVKNSGRGGGERIEQTDEERKAEDIERKEASEKKNSQAIRTHRETRNTDGNRRAKEERGRNVGVNTTSERKSTFTRIMTASRCGDLLAPAKDAPLLKHARLLLFGSLSTATICVVPAPFFLTCLGSFASSALRTIARKRRQKKGCWSHKTI